MNDVRPIKKNICLFLHIRILLFDYTRKGNEGKKVIKDKFK
jgi:hypothetical protein